MSSRIREWLSWAIVPLISLAFAGQPSGDSLAADADAEADTVASVAKCHPSLAKLGVDWIDDPEAPVVARAFNKLWDNRDADCRAAALNTLVREVRKKRAAVSAKTATWVQAAGYTTDIIFFDDFGSTPVDEVYAAIGWDGPDNICSPVPNPSNPIVDVPIPGGGTVKAQRVPIISLSRTGASNNNSVQTVVRVAIPAVANWRWCEARLIVGLFERAKTGDGLEELRVVAGFNRIEWLSSKAFAFSLMALWLTLAYCGTAIAVQVMRKRRARQRSGQDDQWAGKVSWLRCFDPIYVTAGGSGLASVSTLQVFGFSTLVGTILVSMLARFGTLSELSTDILLLLGISAAGTAGAKLTARGRLRLSLENWAWVRNKDWPTSAAVAPSWGQLFTTEGQFDVSKFQMLVFSLIVGFAIVGQGGEGLATFTIPESLLYVLGLSQVIYVGGKAVVPPSIADYNKKLDEVRMAENAFAEAVATQAGSGNPAPQTVDEARKLAPAKYETYAENARQAATMHQVVFGLAVPKDSQEPRLPNG